MIDKPARKLAAALGGAALLVGAACGGASSRPSTAQLEKAISGGSSDSVFGSDFARVPKKGLDCIAKALHDSKLSDSALKAIVDNQKDYKPTKIDKSALSGVQSELMKCVSSMTQ